ncbi:hypothetical protein ACJMK2_007338 [Sinanodonta woodiana]|uniref:Uncharacterized protein n=1 Tax=Sinanodonta woodiana TaxID=1069815 RepID=A0ABD3VJD4_SINWO
MRQESRSQRQDAVTLESDDNMSTGSSTDISMSYGVVHIHGAELSSDESLESSIPSLNSCFEDNPPSYSYSTNLPNTASHTVGKTEPKRPGDLKSATKNGSQIQKMANLSRGEPDGTSRPSDYQKNRVREPWHEVSETEVKVPVESEETDPKTLLSSTQVGDRTESERQDSDSEDHSEKIVLKINQTEDLVKLRDICEGLVFPASLCDAAENSSNEVQGKTLRRDFKAMEANASDKERNQRNVPLHNDDQVQYNNCSFSSELEDEENNLNITTRSKCNTEETCHSYSSLQDKEDIQIETKGVEDSGKDGIDSKSSLEEIVKEANDSFNDTDPDVEESSSDQTSSHSDDDGVCSNGDAELNRELQQPSQGQNDLQNEFNSSSLSVNSDESGIGIEERTIKTVQGS